jgi:hypothetical protein
MGRDASTWAGCGGGSGCFWARQGGRRPACRVGSCVVTRPPALPHGILGDSLAVKLPALTRASLVRIQVPQPGRPSYYRYLVDMPPSWIRIGPWPGPRGTSANVVISRGSWLSYQPRPIRDAGENLFCWTGQGRGCGPAVAAPRGRPAIETWPPQRPLGAQSSRLAERHRSSNAAVPVVVVPPKRRSCLLPATARPDPAGPKRKDTT